MWVGRTQSASWRGKPAAASIAWLIAGALGALGALADPRPSLAQTHEQIVATCRQAAQPVVRACVQARRGSGDSWRALAECMETVGRPFVQACVQREEKRIAASAPAPAPPQAPAPTSAPSEAGPVATVFVAPPRTITDITAILDAEKPDPAQMAQRKAAADAAPPEGVSASELAEFYRGRGQARALLGRNREALADGLKAFEVAGNAVKPIFAIRSRQFIGGQYIQLGDIKQALTWFESIVRFAEATPGFRGAVINASRNMAQLFVGIGNVGQAEAAARRLDAAVQEIRGSPHPGWRASYKTYGNYYEAEADLAHAVIFAARGQRGEAEAAFRRAEAFRRATLDDLDKYALAPPRGQVLLEVDQALLALAASEARLGRLVEAEVDARRALLSALSHQGKYHPTTPQFIIGLASILADQGRYREAEQLVRSALEIHATLAIGDDAPRSARLLSALGNILVAGGRLADAAQIFARLEAAVANWEPRRRDAFLADPSRILQLYAGGQVEAGIAAAEDLVRRRANARGESHFDTAIARGVLAAGYTFARRDDDAVREYKAAIPILLSAASENADTDDSSLVAAQKMRLQRIVEAYMSLRARMAGPSGEVAAETFRLGEAIRGHAVERAMTDAAARLAARDPQLADLVRAEQDRAKQINAALGELTNLLALPSGERDDGAVAAINASVARLRQERDMARAEIGRRFPAYADLVDPKAPTLEQIRAALRPDEALVSFYFGRNRSFVWAMRRDGEIAFAALPITAEELSQKVRQLRAALEPEVMSVADIPAFDLTLAHALYDQLLAPVEATWKPAKELIFATNGALGQLPLSLLPTAAAAPAGDALMFADYRSVPWLARTHAVTVVPSLAALRTLRALPPGNAGRDKLIGFGAPVFNKDQVAEPVLASAAAAPSVASDAVVGADAGRVDTRGIRLVRRASPQVESVDSAELAMLPPLPDTAEELRAMAIALGANPATALHLGPDANEEKVKSLDLTRFKVVAFATHGLVPGDLNGLTQPALALSAPDISGSKGDGLLTMGEILALRLDADWVVLSACNTGAGAGAGAEAASGLGRAFFYAGTRALLVTNWSVHSASARALVSDLFHRQASGPAITRAEALRQSMVDMIDHGVATDAQGRAQFAYAHPFFWAPYTIIGDGGRN